MDSSATNDSQVNSYNKYSQQSYNNGMSTTNDQSQYYNQWGQQQNYQVKVIIGNIIMHRSDNCLVVVVVRLSVHFSLGLSPRDS